MHACEYGKHIRARDHRSMLGSPEEERGFDNCPVPELDEDMKKGILSNCFYCGPYTVWSCSEHRHSEKHLSKVRKFVENNAEKDAIPNCSCRDNAWCSCKKAILSIKSSVKKAAFGCSVCDISLKRVDWASHILSTPHQVRRDAFMNNHHQTLFPVRTCYVCCESIPPLEWSNHVRSNDHLLRATTHPPPSPPPELRRCGVCKVECSIEGWDTHVASNEHIVRTVSQSQTV